MKQKTTLFNFFFYLFPLFVFSQKWISKNENENYTARHECSFVQSGDKFIMFGGREKSSSLDIYNYQTNSWSNGAPAPKEFNHFQATEYDSLIWVIGAFQDNKFPNEVPATNVYIYNPALNYWIKGTSIPKKMRRGGAGLVIKNNKFYLVAGNTIGHNGGFSNRFDVYDPINNTWTALAKAPRARDHFAAAIIDNKLYAASGRQSGGAGGVFAPVIKEVDVYDFATEQWTTLPKHLNLPTGRAGTSVVNFKNELLIIGGEGEQKGPAYKKVEAFNPSSNSWTRKADLNFGRHGTQAIVSGEGIYIAGGSPRQGGGRQKNMEVFHKDLPKGKPIVASTLKAVNAKVQFSGKETKDIVLKSTGGNAGNYITNVTISGKNASSFMIKATLKNHFVKSNTSQNLLISSKSTEINKSAKVTVTYDNGKTVIVDLSVVDEPAFLIDDFDMKSSISVYPLPVDELLKVKTTKKITSIEVYDMGGDIEVSRFIKVNNTYVVDLLKMKSGVYLLKVEMASGKAYHKRIIKS